MPDGTYVRLTEGMKEEAKDNLSVGTDVEGRVVGPTVGMRVGLEE